MNNTKTIVTIGSACSDINVLRELFMNGMDVARLNMGTCTYEFCQDIIEKINTLNKDYSKKIAIMVDIAGPEMKIGEIENGVSYLSAGDKIRVYVDQVIGDKTKFSVDYSNLIDDIKIDDFIKLDKGNISLKVLDKGVNYILCEVLVPGEIRSYMTLNVPGRKINLPFLSKKDINDIQFACNNNCDFLALSFVSCYEDVLQVSDLLIKFKNDNIGILSKIENESALEEIDDIIKASDGIIVARGDLGVEMAIERVPLIQKEIINKCYDEKKISIVSTDFLSSMENSLMPSRAEVSDVANAVLDGTDAILLTDETSFGNHPIETLKIMYKIINATEQGIHSSNNLIDNNMNDITSAVAYSVVSCAKNLNCKFIVAPTISGYTARKLSGFRPKCPIIALTFNIDVAKSLSLYYGVYPVITQRLETFDEIIELAHSCIKSITKNDVEGKIIITGGYPFSKVKHTNFMKIEEL